MGARARRRLRDLALVPALALLLTLPTLPAFPCGPAPLLAGAPASSAALPPGPAHAGSPAVDPRTQVAPVEPLVGGGQGRVLVNTTDASSVPNDGLRVNLTDFPPSTLPADSSFQASVEEGIGGFLAVFGIFENTGTEPTAFFSVFTNQTNQNVRLGYWTSLALVPGEAYDFELVRANGTNWTLTVNRALFGGNASAASFDFGAVEATWLSSIGYSEVAIYSTTSTVPASLSVPLAFAVLRPSGWYLPDAAAASYVGSGGAQWGVQGRLQRGTLAPGELETGSTIGNVTTGTLLWTGGIVPVSVSIAPASPSGVATVPTQVSLGVHTLSGAPIPSVPVYLSDALNGTFVPSTVVTDPTGAGSSLFETPNVSRVQPDLLRATVTIFGYSGSTSTTYGLTPPRQVVLTADPPSPTVSPGGRVAVTFLASNRTGGVEPAVQLTFVVESTTGAPTTEPTFGSTGPDGRLTVTVVAASATGSIVLSARVVQVGAWGHANVSIPVRSAPPSIWAQYSTALLEGALAIAIAALAAALILRSRRGRRGVPPMPLRRYLREREAERGPNGRAPPVSRRPPSSGSP